MVNTQSYEDYPNIKEYQPDGVEKVDQDIEFDMSDDELSERIKRREREWRGDYEKLQSIAVENRNYWRGNQINLNELYEGETPIVINRIFQSIETIVPIVTRRTPEPDVTVRPYDKESLELQELLEIKLKEEWELDQEMQSKLEEGIRNLCCTRYMAMKYIWNDDKKDFEYILMPMGKLSFMHKATCMEECPAIIEYVSDSIGALKKKYPDKVKEIDAQKGSIENASDDSFVDYIEYWEDEFYACQWKDILLYKEKNPNFNYPETTANDKGTEVTGEVYNFFSKPQKPYIFLNWMGFGDSMLDDTTIIEQAKTPQDGVNKRKRQIEENMGMSNGKMIGAGNKISREDFNNINHSPEEGVYLEGADNTQGAIDYMYGRAMDNGVLTDMSDTKTEIDNIMGTHSTTRGEQTTQETATGRAILKESDVGRLEILSRRIEKFAQSVYGSMLQMMFVWYTEQHPIHMLDKQNDPTSLNAKEKESYIVNKELFKKSFRILVQNGSTTPRDKQTVKAEAVDLWKNKGMSTVDMYRILEYPDAEQLAKNAFIEQTAPESLYGSPTGDAYDIDAIRHIKLISEDMHAEPLKTSDIQIMTNHIVTHQEYLKGTDIDSDLPPFKSLDSQQRAKMRKHIEEEIKNAEELAKKQPPVPPQEQPLPPAGAQPPMDPSMVPPMDPNMLPPMGPNGSPDAIAAGATPMPPPAMMPQQPPMM